MILCSSIVKMARALHATSPSMSASSGLMVGNSATVQRMPFASSVRVASIDLGDDEPGGEQRRIPSLLHDVPALADRERVAVVEDDRRIVATEPHIRRRTQADRGTNRVRRRHSIGRIENGQVREAPQDPQILDAQVCDAFDAGAQSAESGNHRDRQTRITDECPELFSARMLANVA